MSVDLDPTREQWLPIAGWPAYEVSSHGRVLSHHRGRSRLLKLTLSNTGYLYVTLCAEDRKRKRTVHCLVAEAFHGPRIEGQVVRHLDGNKLHNVAWNLALGTPSENMYDTVRHGGHAMVNRTSCPAGHEYTDENTHIYQGRRFCKTCKVNRSVEERRRQGKLLIVGRDPYKPCPQGREWTEENTYHSGGKRFCRTCARARSREFYIRKALAAANVPELGRVAA